MLDDHLSNLICKYMHEPQSNPNPNPNPDPNPKLLPLFEKVNIEIYKYYLSR